MFGDSILFNLNIPGEPKTGRTFYNEIANEDQIPFAFPAIQQYWIGDMFDAIRAQLTTASEKLAHLRRFL